jgi:hemoglobin/transferrin/lactoferrin receptor protein
MDMSRRFKNGRTRVLALLALGFAALAAPASVTGQEEEDELQTDTMVVAVDRITVTATRNVREVFKTPTPVSVLSQARIQDRTPNNAADLFRDVPGLDVNGVGVTQVRPSIRGQRGQRILLLADGMRLNNSRRQQDFGEIPALLDVGDLQRIEVVRGPASVLYGTDAIGGVVNMITRTPVQDGLHGTLGYRYGSVAGQNRVAGRALARYGAFDVKAGFTVRNAGAYDAPSGTFGDIDLTDDTPVLDTGVKDRSLDLRMGYQLSQRNAVWLKYEGYRADDAGFGYVDPEAYDPDGAEIRIRYPNQDFWKATVGYGVKEANTALFDRVDMVGYLQDNRRTLTMDIATSFGPQAPPGAGMVMATENFTDLSTTGFRIEARKLAGQSLLFTYGVDFFRDRSENTDQSNTTIVGFGPPSERSSTETRVPNATYRSFGVFAQSEVELSSRATIVLGARYQGIRAETQETPDWSGTQTTKTDQTLVGSVNAIMEVAQGLSVVGTVGRAFRAPNIIEWFFEGPTPEGSGYQVSNPDLTAETSLNFDLGLRYRNDWIAAETFVFRNTIYNGIRIAPVGEEIDGMPAFRNVNVDELMYRGVEVQATAFLPAHLSLTAGYTYLDSKDVLEPNNPVGETFASKVTGTLRYDAPGGRFWAAYDVRHNGDQKDVALGTNPIGDYLPSFTVHNLRGGVTVFQSASGIQHRLGLTIANLTNELYAEFGNASFFRPEPKRNLFVTYELAF